MHSSPALGLGPPLLPSSMSASISEGGNVHHRASFPYLNSPFRVCEIRVEIRPLRWMDGGMETDLALLRFSYFSQYYLHFVTESARLILILMHFFFIDRSSIQ